MKKQLLLLAVFVAAMWSTDAAAQNRAQNPVIFADVPDMSIIRIGDTYYMSSTTMHMSPGVPIMKSTDLVNWELVSYAYDILEDVDALNLENGEDSYGGGSWASSLRYHNGRYYVGTFSGRTNKTYIYSTENIEGGPWKEFSFSPSYHDHTLYFDDDGTIYLIWGVGDIMMVELKEDLSGVKEGTERVIIENASEPAGDDIMLQAEGSQIFKVDDYYYLFNITWPTDGIRTVIIHRADNIEGPYESRLALEDRGIAQGGLIDTPDGDWFAFLFRDYGSVGRIPYLVPVTWEDGWPVLGIDGKVPDELDLPANESLIPGIVASDDFKRRPGEPDLSLVWQWNHNPVDDYWSINRREGYLRLTNGRLDARFVQTQNTLTQRTIGPVSSGITAVDVSSMKEGDFAGLALLQYRHGKVGVKYEDGEKSVVMVHAEGDEREEIESIPLEQDVIYLKAECDFRNMTDIAYFYYSLDGKEWTRIGSRLDMTYTLPHFMGYRFSLFNYATQTAGGYVDFQFFHIEETISEM
ncbi:glycoside hydrolase 43 family protein [Balneolales bacterium ANBcel1]|nr:glycoside hydrolase 43 family protein [Balneolales bacterium ANBcel1]